MKSIAGFGVGVAIGLVAFWLTLPSQSPVEIYAEAYKHGRADALKVKINGNPNWELEQVCVGMWMEKQEERK
jgi:hypothetical protein